MSVLERYLCPECGKEMEKGCMVSRGGIFWAADVPIIKAWTPANKVGESFGKSSEFKPFAVRTRSPHLLMHRCRSCGIFKQRETPYSEY